MHEDSPVLTSWKYILPVRRQLELTYFAWVHWYRLQTSVWEGVRVVVLERKRKYFNTPILSPTEQRCEGRWGDGRFIRRSTTPSVWYFTNKRQLRCYWDALCVSDTWDQNTLGFFAEFTSFHYKTLLGAEMGSNRDGEWTLVVESSGRSKGRVSAGWAVSLCIIIPVWATP